MLIELHCICERDEEGRQSPCSDKKSGSDRMSQTSHCYDNVIYSKELQDILLIGKLLLAPTQALLPCSNDKQCLQMQFIHI